MRCINFYLLQGQSVEISFLELIYKTRQNRQLYINHGTVLKATVQREAADDFANADPMTVLMECIGKLILQYLCVALYDYYTSGSI